MALRQLWDRGARPSLGGPRHVVLIPNGGALGPEHVEFTYTVAESFQTGKKPIA